MASDEAAYKPDKELIQKVLREYENDANLEVKSVVTSPGCEKGVNYMSVIKRLVVTGTTGAGFDYNKSFISKHLAANEIHQEVFQSQNFFVNEARMYQTVPMLLGKDQEILPDCLFTNVKQIILEDLKPLGFFLEDRVKGLDFDHTKIVLEGLADLHAASFILEHNDAEKFNRMKTNFVEAYFPDTDPPGVGKNMNDFPNFIVLCLKVAATSEDDYSKEIAFMEEHQGKIYDLMKELVKPREYSVVCHGDLWINNILFKHEEVKGKTVVSGMRFLDFQVVRFGPLVTDLQGFLHSSVQHEVLVEYYDTFLEIYYMKLRSKLSELRTNAYEKITLDWLKCEMQRSQIYGMMVSLWLAPALLANLEDIPDKSAIAMHTAETTAAVDYWKQRLSPRLLQRIVDKCKYFIK
ncbi:uncharacterized protein LOC124179612 isoform X1 [Neodiprion fabricii]|uniref:uncharacterized protein LOC124179612 isoform X1 n=1 Tax=Neodiprion fabricii TaxID=2872261 RepID=UPI001ED984A9|nr:uncharacterized protein LOC124179612 isoform X1 [Neodiprion fabricii]